VNKISPAVVALGETNDGVIRCFATNHRTTILRVAVISMALFAVPWLVLNFVKLLLAQGPWGAVDLGLQGELAHLAARVHVPLAHALIE